MRKFKTIFDLFVKKIEKLLPPVGINLGSGPGWRYLRFIPIDRLNGWTLDSHSTLPFKRYSIKYAFTSHFLEHVDDATVKNIFKELYRVLKKRGVFRIIVPDFEKILCKYRESDIKFFFDEIGFRGRPEWHKHGVEPSLENILLHYFGNYDSLPENVSSKMTQAELDDADFYRGPPKNVPPELVHKNAMKMGVGEFSRWVVGLTQAGFAEHINWFNFSKLQSMLHRAGFKVVYLSGYGASRSRVLRNYFFDKYNNRSSWSLYVEAIK